MFQPPRCPHRNCPHHDHPTPRFFVRHGSYRPRCRSGPVPRFRCRACRRTFSRQTFRMDYRDHRPDLNALLFKFAASGVGIRQCGRMIGLSYRLTALKLRKIARHTRRLNLSMRKPLEGGVSFHLDEIETYEEQRGNMPLSVPVLVHSSTRYIVWAESAPIRPRGKLTDRRKEAIARAEKRYGPRRDLSRRSLERTLARGRELVSPDGAIEIDTDEKSSYPGLIAEAFEGARVEHRQTNSKLVRRTWNPLFAINNEEAVMRDLMSRLRRESWHTSKRRRYLDLGLHIHMAYRNLVRRRFNRDEGSPAQLLGFAPRRLTAHEVLSWRQDWGRQSIHPLSRSGRTVEAWRARGSRAA